MKTFIIKALLTGILVYSFLPENVLAILPNTAIDPLRSSIADNCVATRDHTKIPGIEPLAKVIASVGWQDKLGENLLILSQSEVMAEKSANACRKQSGCYNAEILVQHFLLKGTEKHLLRKVRDFANGCPTSINLGFLKNSLTITDLDSDGIAEVTFLYSMLCQDGDASPVMKLIMLENNKKYALRGQKTSKTRQISPAASSGAADIEERKPGYSIDDAYKAAPRIFLLYSEIRWDKYK